MKIDTIEIAKLELQRGDILLVRVPPDWSKERCGRADEAIQETMRIADVHGVPVLIGSTDVEFQIVRDKASD